MAEGSELLLRGLRHGYPTAGGWLEVFAGFELSVRRGELLSLIGPSGCGKTTLLHLWSGLAAASGGAFERPTATSALVFQRPCLLPWLSVSANAAFGLRAAGMVAKEADKRARALLAQLGLGRHFEDYPHQLSTGMAQRVNLARALLVEPELLLLDEPFAALDVITRRQLHDQLLHQWQRRGCTMVLVSHALDEVAYLSDRVVVLSDKPCRPLTTIEVNLARPRAADATAKLQLLEIVDQLELALGLKRGASAGRLQTVGLSRPPGSRASMEEEHRVDVPRRR